MEQNDTFGAESVWEAGRGKGRMFRLSFTSICIEFGKKSMKQNRARVRNSDKLLVYEANGHCFPRQFDLLAETSSTNILTFGLRIL